ncbi:MAG TPA: LacI family DNA-binding transcriptional regulator [Patescibacteria group bacterium]|nr:LacI family DNA-binding transcriptional regulator [Patescibacteria group bacterium]
MTNRNGPATIRDVALRAGVSTATVSRVLAGIGRPRPATAATVMSAVEALGYRPSGVARSLRMRHTRTLGLIVTDIQNPFFPELVQAADQAARSLGYSILLGSAAYDEQRAMHYLDLMVDRRVDGIVVASSQISEGARRWLLASPVPVVVVNAEPADLPVTVISSDNVGGMRLATAHLVQLGHRRIAYVRGAPSFSADVPRLEGFRLACRDAGLPVADTPEIAGDGQPEGGERAVAELLGGEQRVTAIACYNDMTAIGVLRALRAAGVSVPPGVSVVGCDDIAAASWIVPSLTTVAQQKAEMGRLAVERLAATLDDPDSPSPPAVVRLPMELRVRESSGPVPVGAGPGTGPRSTSSVRQRTHPPTTRGSKAASPSSRPAKPSIGRGTRGTGIL